LLKSDVKSVRIFLTEVDALNVSSLLAGLLERNAKNKAGLTPTRNQDAIGKKVLQPDKQPPKSLTIGNETAANERKTIQYKKPKEGETDPVSIEIKGKFLHNAQIIPPAELTVQGVRPSEDGASVKADVILNPNTKAGKYKLTVFDPQFPENKKQVEFEVLPKS
jgi:hypothetical protein